jgi:glycogen debranching enzyme
MATAPKTQDVYLLPLADDGAPKVEGQYILLPPPNKESPYRVCFEIQGTSSICRQGSLWVNIPAKGEQFKRDHYREYK